MDKPYSEQLSEWVRRRARPGRHEQNLAAFLAVRDDVTDALEQGWPVKTIWTHMVEQKRIGFGYDTFLSHVNRHVRAREQAAAPRANRQRAPAPAARAPRAARQPRDASGAKDGAARLPGFTFDAAPNREELI